MAIEKNAANRGTSLSKEQVIAVVKASLAALYRRNPKIITAFNKKLEDGFLNETQQLDYLDGMYTAIIDYSKKNDIVKQTIIKYNYSINESLKDYASENKSIIWKIGYVTIQYEIANRSTRRLRLYMDLFMTSKSIRFKNGKYIHSWKLVRDEKIFMRYFEHALGKVAERVEFEQETRINPSEVFLNFSLPQNSSEFYWPFPITSNPSSPKELQNVIKLSGYEDDDLDMRTNAVFTTDGKYGLSLQVQGADCYIFLIKKTGRYWNPYLINGKSLFVKYNFTRTFNDNIQLLLMYYENIFPIRIKK